MACEASSSPRSSSRLTRFFSLLPVPGLTTAAVMGALCWVFALWIGPWLIPGHTAATATHPQAASQVRSTVPVPNNAVVSATAQALPSRPNAVTKTVSVRRGDTLMAVLTRANVQKDDAHAAVAALRKVYDPRSLMPGMQLNLTFQPLSPIQPTKVSFRQLEFTPSIEKTVGVHKTWNNQFKPYSEKAKLSREETHASGRIDSSLYVDAAAAGVPVPVIAELIHAMSYEVDFQRDIHPRDHFEVLYNRIEDADGKVVGSGGLLYGSLTLAGKKIAVYRFRESDGNYDYFDSKGRSVRRLLMRTPIDGARLSSPFGRRKDPILGFTRMHKGVDFAAPKGTPIMASGNGVVVMERRWGGYGNYIRIRHNATYSTAYGHMNRFAKGIHRGMRVHQGEIIGYVGTTGHSTGPHLHYEVLRNNVQVNPLSVNLPTGKTLHGHALARFEAARNQIDVALNKLPVIASRSSAKNQGSKVH